MPAIPRQPDIKLDLAALTQRVRELEKASISLGPTTGQPVLTGPVLQSSAPGSGLPRVVMDTDGIHFYDVGGDSTIDLDTESGQATITGTFQTAPDGEYPRAKLYNTDITYGSGYAFQQDIGISYETAVGSSIPFVGVHYSSPGGVDNPTNSFVVRNSGQGYDGNAPYTRVPMVGSITTNVDSIYLDVARSDYGEASGTGYLDTYLGLWAKNRLL